MSRPNIRLWVTIFFIILIIFLVSIFGVLKAFQKELHARTGENVTFFTTAKSVFTLNYDSELEVKLKAESMNHVYENISIYYQEENEKLIPLTIETLKWAEDKSAEILGRYSKKPIDFIFMSRENLEQLSNIDSAGGYYSNFEKVMGVNVNPDDVESILQELETPLFFFQRKILHEYTHYATFKKIEEAETFGDTFPSWFIEGIAEYVGNDGTEVPYESNPYETLPLESISWDNEFHEARQIEHANPYMQSYFTVNYLIQVYGKEVVVELIEKTNDTVGFYTALEQITGKTISEFEQDVLDYYQ
ncbi:peptidase MA family metallohydrolase [Mesobacillus sp.]|uniref:peptidase MA family metallohydrolase n=1 Tax=Mesobacillus sp. TaxID=2675271 RepID=UPI0039EEE3C0